MTQINAIMLCLQENIVYVLVKKPEEWGAAGRSDSSYKYFIKVRERLSVN